MNSKDTRAAILVTKRAPGGSVRNYWDPKPVDNYKNIYVVHGGSDFEEIDKSYSGRGEPGNIRPLGKGLYGFVVNPDDGPSAKASIKYASRFAEKYGGKNKKLHVFAIPKASTTSWNGPKTITDMGSLGEFNEPDVSNLQWPHPNRAKDKAWDDYRNSADVRMESTPSGLTEAAINNPGISNRIAKFKHDESPDKVLDAIKNHAISNVKIAKATGGVVLGDQRQANLSKFMEGNHPLVPPVLYHGTGRDISSFDTNAKRSYDVDPRNVDETDSGWYGKGHYLTSNPRVASHYASESEKRSESKSGANIIPVHVSMKNPFFVSRLGGSEMDRHLDAAGAAPPKNGKWRRASEQTEWLKYKGYDGVIANDKKDPGAGTEYVVFDSAQIKSAIGNNGQFDPTSKDITKATGGAVTDNDNFKSWFGDSVTHTNGTPHVFYTGTSKDKDFNSFNVGRHGSWFTQDPEVASQYAESNDSQGYKSDGWNVVKTNTASRVIPAYIKAEKPYTGELPTEALSDNYKNSQSAWFDKLRAQGYDSWIPASSGGKLAVVLKEPQQIKSLYNSGSFDPKQKHMNKATGGAVTGDMPDTTQRNLNSVGLYSKAAVKLIQQHDLEIKPEKIKGSDGTERFGFSFTPRAKRSIMKGQPAFARGGKVEPSDAQKSAGNYKKKHINFQGLPISIENEKGSIRSGQDEKGNKWSVKMPADYGYVNRTEGADGDHVDVYVGPDESSSNVFVIDQKNHRTGKFDEHKVMLGFDSLRSAIQSYTNGFSDGKAHLRLGNVARLSMKEFKQWLSHHDTKKPIRNQSAIDKALSVAKSAQGAKNGI